MSSFRWCLFGWIAFGFGLQWSARAGDSQPVVSTEPEINSDEVDSDDAQEPVARPLAPGNASSIRGTTPSNPNIPERLRLPANPSASLPSAAGASASVSTTPAPVSPAPRPVAAPNPILSAFAAPDTRVISPRSNAAAIARANTSVLTPVYVPNMFGDQSPPTIRVGQPSFVSSTPNFRPPRPPGPAPNPPPAKLVVPSARGFKIADNQSPEPRDRFFYTFNYFDDLNGPVNRQLHSPIVSERAYRHLFGFEKTFLGGEASIGFRLPLNTLAVNNPLASNTTTAVGDLSIFAKYVLWRSEDRRNLISAGLAITPPTGPSNFAGAPSLTGFRTTSIQPFIGGIYRKDRFYAQAFEAIDISTNTRDVTLIYNDFAIGYFLYQATDPKAFLTAIVPTFETHVNVPLNHRGAARFNDPSGTADQVNLTFGTTFVLRQNATLSFAFGQPLVGPNAFNYEASVLLNYYYGRSRNVQPTLTPPVL